jgi:hypothetical protein
MYTGIGIGAGVNYYIIHMPRKARINQPGLTRRIMTRPFNDLSLFRDDEDRTFFTDDFLFSGERAWFSDA